MNFTFLVVVLLTALAFVGVVIALSRAISPRSYNLQKFEAYECGIPTRPSAAIKQLMLQLGKEIW